MNIYFTARQAFTVLALLLAGLSLAGCKIVVKTPEQEAEIPADASGDDARTAQRIADTFESQLLPHVEKSALSVSDLKTALAQGLDKAGEEHGNRGSGQGAAWNFAVRGEGVVVETKLETRARWAAIDTDADGAADVTVQLGPVIRGTALRDFAPFYNFDDFRDQIEFAKLGRGINDQIATRLSVIETVPEGKVLKFVGVVPLKSAGEAWTVTPTLVEIMP